MGGFQRRPLLHDRDAVLDQAIGEAAAILGDSLVRVLFPTLADHGVDLLETESPHVTAG